MGKWSTGKWNSVNKSVALYGPQDFEAEIDFDDVDHEIVQQVGEKMVEVLNANWPADFVATRTEEEEEESNG